MQTDYEKMRGELFKQMIHTIQKEVANGRHPRVTSQFASAAKVYLIEISSEQINEKLELNPAEFANWAKLLKANDIPLEKR